MIVYECLYILFVIGLANINAYLIKQDKTIHHWINGLIHLTIAIIGAFIWWWGCFFIILLNTRIVFDGLLNVFRGLPLNYIPANPQSLIDKAEIKVFGRDWYWPRAIYLAISFGLNITYLVFIK